MGPEQATRVLSSPRFPQKLIATNEHGPKAPNRHLAAFASADVLTQFLPAKKLPMTVSALWFGAAFLPRPVPLQDLAKQGSPLPALGEQSPPFNRAMGFPRIPLQATHRPALVPTPKGQGVRCTRLVLYSLKCVPQIPRPHRASSS